VTAVKEGGGADPVANTQLARVLADARRLSVPVDLIERNLKRATDTSQADYMELTYEGTYFISQIPPPRFCRPSVSTLVIKRRYCTAHITSRLFTHTSYGKTDRFFSSSPPAYGAGGVGIVIEVLSDNVNRAAADTKAAINKSGGKVAEPGSVLFNFERKGFISLNCSSEKEDEVFEVAAENGGDDIVPRDDGGEGFVVTTEVVSFMQCQKALADAGFEINADDTALKMTPLAEVEGTYFPITTFRLPDHGPSLTSTH
jgi:transcriptional/translational regulatory protein YebC/TACO1